jgi:hypothetical protein
MNTTKHHTKGITVRSTGQQAKTPRGATGLFALLGSFLCVKGSGAPKIARGSGVSAIVLTMGALVVALPASASAYATIEGPPEYSAAPGLPDGRVYEQVSPADKNGNEAGANSTPYGTSGENRYGLAAPDGDAVLFEGTGPMGESPSQSSLWFAATKNAGAAGWSTHALLPQVKLTDAVENGLFTEKGFTYIDPSRDLTHAMAEFAEGSLSPQVNEACRDRINLVGPDPFVTPTMLEQASPELAEPIENCETEGFAGAPVGGSPDFSTVYFTYPGTLLPADAERTSHAHAGHGPEEPVEAWGFYEYSGGALHEAGVLPGPGETVSPFGAVPAASGHGRNPHGNEVSENGSRAFFVSPDPASCEPAGHNDCATDPPELYVRENGDRTQLVSEDTLLPAGGALPAAAPSGVLHMPNHTFNGLSFVASYVFASPDGSQAFFQSDDALTGSAAEDSPGGAPKTYDFDVNTGTLTYLPGVEGEILATDQDGSSMAFLQPEAGGEPEQLDLWTTGPAGGTVTPVVKLPEPGAGVPETRMSNDGSVLVFQTPAQLSSTFNSGGQEEIYRYDVSENSLGCVSCAPAGVAPNGSASLSVLHFDEGEDLHSDETPRFPVDQRGVSADGDRVFFETPTPLVPQDSNTNSPPVSCHEVFSCPQGSDVYEWENGVVYLISTGKSPRNSYLLDSSANGDDVFFATTEGLVPSDTDGGYDVYDARIPHEGEPYPAGAVPCEGSVCQGPPNVPSPLTTPASATFSGLGNPTPEVTPPPAKTTTKTVKCKKGFTKKNNKCVKNKKNKTKAKKSAHTDRRVSR